MFFKSKDKFLHSYASFFFQLVATFVKDLYSNSNIAKVQLESHFDNTINLSALLPSLHFQAIPSVVMKICLCLVQAALLLKLAFAWLFPDRTCWQYSWCSYSSFYRNAGWDYNWYARGAWSDQVSTLRKDGWWRNRLTWRLGGTKYPSSPSKSPLSMRVSRRQEKALPVMTSPPHLLERLEEEDDENDFFTINMWRRYRYMERGTPTRARNLQNSQRMIMLRNGNSPVQVQSRAPTYSRLTARSSI